MLAVSSSSFSAACRLRSASLAPRSCDGVIARVAYLCVRSAWMSSSAAFSFGMSSREHISAPAELDLQSSSNAQMHSQLIERGVVHDAVCVCARTVSPESQLPRRTG